MRHALEDPCSSIIKRKDGLARCAKGASDGTGRPRVREGSAARRGCAVKAFRYLSRIMGRVYYREVGVCVFVP